MTHAPRPEDRRARPETEDFGEKYDSSGRIGSAMINGYFVAVDELLREVEGVLGGEFSALEIGCGEGHSTKRILEVLPEGVDFAASEFVEHQVELASANNPGVMISSEDVYSLQREDDSLDCVLLLEVLEHLDEPAVALHEIRRVLRPGGCLLLGVPREPLWRILNMARLTYLSSLGNTPGHLQHWSSRGIARFVSTEFGAVISTRRPVPWTLLMARVD